MLLQVCKERNKLKEIEEMLQIYLYTIKTNIGVSLPSSKQCFSEKGWNASYEHEFILKSWLTFLKLCELKLVFRKEQGAKEMTV